MDGQDSVDAIINALLNERNRAIWNCSVPTIGTGNVTGTGGRMVDLSNPSQSTRVEFAVEDLPMRNLLNQNAILSGSTRDSRRGHPGGLSRDEKRSRNREIQARYRARQRELRLQTEQKYESMLAQLQQARLENQRQKMKLEILGKLLTVRSSFANTLENSSVKLNNDDNDGNIGRQGNFAESEDTKTNNTVSSDADGRTGESGKDALLQQAGKLVVGEMEGDRTQNSAPDTEADAQNNEVVEGKRGGSASGSRSIHEIAEEIRQCVEESFGVGQSKGGYELAQANSIVAGIREKVASGTCFALICALIFKFTKSVYIYVCVYIGHAEEYAEKVSSAISSLPVEEFHHFLSMFASASRNAFIMVDMPMHRACMYEDKSYDAKRKLAVQEIMPMYSKFIVHVYGIAKYRPKLMLRFFPDPNDSRKILVGNMSPIVSCLHFSEEQKQSILDARDACCASRNGRLAMLSEKYLVLQEVFESSSFESMQAMTKSYLDLFDGAGRFIEGALDDLELNEIMIWMAKMGRTMDILQKCVMFGMCYPQLPNIVQIPDLC